MSTVKDVYYKKASHGNEQCAEPEATGMVRRSSQVERVGPSKVPGFSVVRASGIYIRVCGNSIR